jgi:outer membrane protein OmpA-like peptidoglycan-associated protein
MLAIVLAAVAALALAAAYFAGRSSGSLTQEARIAEALVDGNAVKPSTVHARVSSVVERQAPEETEERVLAGGLERTIEDSGSSSTISTAATDVVFEETPVTTPASEFTEESAREDESMVTSEPTAEASRSPESYPAESNPQAGSGATISVNFSFDSDELDEESRVALDAAVVALNEHPDSIAAITGFTDNQGDEEYNLVLSRKRADAVKQYLVGAGIGQDRLRVEGRGALTSVAIENFSDDADALEPYRVVQIELSSEAGSH